MDFEKLLKEFKCSCGKVHSCDIKRVIVEKGAISKISALCENYNDILLVADKNTFKTCGEEVKTQLSGKCSGVCIFECDGFLVPDEEAIERLSSFIAKNTDLIMGIGSGVIQDLCKYVSFEKGLPYHIVATAPSMDGYASKGAAMIIKGMKVTYNAHTPEAIIGDVDILKNAPLQLIQSGYGDILGKFSCLNDWKLAEVVNGEYMCEYVYNLTYDMLCRTKDLGEKLLNREEEAIKTLMEALVGVGVAMAYVGNSRPASGSEHHLSHFFEIVGLIEDKPYFLHGTDVVYSAVVTQMLREELLKLDDPGEGYKFCKEEYEKRIHEIYKTSAGEVLSLQEKLGWYNEPKISVYKEKWQEIKAVLSEVPSSSQLCGYLKSIGLDMAEFKNMYGEEKINNAVYFAKDLKDRYSVLWMYFEIMYGGIK